jgi:trans-aconitate methyltransferase
MHTNTLSTEVSRNFWKNQDYYPQYGDVIKKRRLHETKFLTDWIWKNKITSLSDIGCGNGSSVTMLQELTDIGKFYCYDISEGMLNKIDTRGVRQAIIETHQIDLCNIEQDFLPTDLTTVLGVNMYLTDEQVISLMSKIQSKTVILRDPTSETREEINKYSKDLGSEYSAVYRTVDEYAELYSKAGYHITSAFRAYPDEIESKFGTMQFFFTCEKK